MPILSSGQIFNESPQKGSLNPQETHFYKYQVKFTPPIHFCEHISWEILGDIPKNIKIDKDSGLISGTIKHFKHQPSCQKNKSNPQMELNGKNWDNSGRFKPDYYDFKFTIKRTTWISLPNPSNGAFDCSNRTIFIETSNVFIREIKNYNLDNYLVIEKYLTKGKSSIFNIDGNSIEIKPCISVNNKTTESFSSAKSKFSDLQKPD